jgi:hypothetical protein
MTSRVDQISSSFPQCFPELEFDVFRSPALIKQKKMFVRISQQLKIYQEATDPELQSNTAALVNRMEKMLTSRPCTVCGGFGHEPGTNCSSLSTILKIASMSARGPAEVKHALKRFKTLFHGYKDSCLLDLRL